MEDTQSELGVSAPSVTVKDLDDLVAEIFAQRELIADMDAAVSKENVKLSQLEQKAVLYLEELGRDKYQTDRGTISIQEKWRFNLPKTDEDKQAFFNYLREKGLYDRYATINAQSFNSYCVAEFEAAMAEGRGLDFSLPGVGEPKLFKKLGTRRK